MAFNWLKKEWHRFWSDPAGERFENHAHRMKREAPRRRIVHTAVGGAAIVAGTAMLVVPGPGALTLAFGLALIAGNSPALARRLDSTERVIRRRMKPAHENR